MTKVFNRLHVFLSHHSFLYATIVGIGIVLFWRGVWHTVDTLHLYVNHYNSTGSASIIDHPWWDGPLSFIVGCLVLFVTRAFVSSFIGNELILSGLRKEERLAKETEGDVKLEVLAIGDIKQEINSITKKLEELEAQVITHHK